MQNSVLAMPVPERVRLLDRQASAAGTAAVEPTWTYSRRPVGRLTAPSQPENFHLPGRLPDLHERYFESVRALTLDHGEPISWSISNDFNRRSSSCFWDSVSSIFAYSAITLSHKASAKIIRSDIVSDCIS